MPACAEGTVANSIACGFNVLAESGMASGWRGLHHRGAVCVLCVPDAAATPRAKPSRRNARHGRYVKLTAWCAEQGASIVAAYEISKRAARARLALSHEEKKHNGVLRSMSEMEIFLAKSALYVACLSSAF